MAFDISELVRDVMGAVAPAVEEEAIGFGTPPAAGGLNPALIQSESGGNYGAARTNEDGRTFTGRGQFGMARLTDLGMGKDFTFEDFRDNENVQRMVEGRHSDDINSYIDSNDLGKYVGQKFNGVPMTREGMEAVAHLGGKNGLRKFLNSGGEYNPSDELGTSLMSYANKFSTGEANNEAFEGNERITEGTLGGGPAGGPVPSPLMAFSQAADIKADKISQLAMQSPDDLAMGTAVPDPSVGVSRASPSDSPVIPAGAVSDAGPEGGGLGGLMDTISSTLFPNQEDPRGSFSELIGGLGVGLSQMSSGETVNLQPYFKNIQAQKQTIIDANRANAQQVLDNEFRDRSIRVQEGQLSVQDRKLALDTANAMQTTKPGGGVFTEEQMKAIQDNPVTRHLVPQLGSTNPEIYEQALKDYNKIVAANLDSTDQSGGMSGLFTTLMDPNATTEQIAAALDNIDPDDVNDVLNMPGLKNNKTAMIKNTEHLRELAKTDPEAAKAFKIAMRLEAGLGDVDRQVLDFGMDKMDQYGAAADSATRTRFAIVSMRKVSDEIIKRDGDTSALGDMLGKIQGIAAGMGYSSVDEFLAKNVTGATSKQLEQMTQAEKILASEIAMQMLKGQGSVSDAERKSLAESIVAGNTSSSQRSRALSRLEVMNEIDQIVYEEFMDGVGDKFEHSVRANRRVLSVIKPAITPISMAITANDMYHRAPALLDKGDKAMQGYVDLAKRIEEAAPGSKELETARDEFLTLRAPVLSAEQAGVFKKMLHGHKITHYIDAKTNQLVSLSGTGP